MRAEAFGNGPVADFLAAHSKPNGSAPPVFEPVWWEQIMLAATAWLIRGVLPRFGLAALYGAPGCGKSFLALLLAWCIARGVDVLGRRCTRVGVLYLGAEDAEGLRLRIAALRQEHDSEPIPFLFVPAPLGFNAGDANHMAGLIDTAREHAAEFEERGAPLGLIIADTFARSLPGLDENSAPAMSDAIAKLAALGRELNALVLIVHHAGKDATRGLRGHSSLLAALDASLEVQRDVERDARSLKLAKAKNGPDGLEWPFELKPVHLGVDADGEDITSCVAVILEPGEAAPKDRATVELPAFKPLKGQKAIVARVIAQAIRDAGGEPVLEADVRPGGLAQLRSDDNENADKAARQGWNRGVEALIAEKIMERVDGVLTMGNLAVARFAGIQGRTPPDPERVDGYRRAIAKTWSHGGRESRDDAPFVASKQFRETLRGFGWTAAQIEHALSLHAPGGLIATLIASGDVKSVEGGFCILNEAVIAAEDCAPQGEETPAEP